MNQVLNLVTSIQLMVHTPLLNVQFPANAFVLYEELIKLVMFELFPAQDIFPKYMDFPDRGYFNEKFERLDYGSFYSIMLLGTVFLIMLWMLMLYFLCLLIAMCRMCCLWPQNILRSLKKQLFCKQWVIFSYATFLEIIIIVVLQAMIVDDDWFETRWVLYSFLVWLFLNALLCFIFFVTFVIVCWMHSLE